MEREVRTTERRYDTDRMRIFLQPIAAASILGLFAFAGASWVVGAQFAGWYSGPSANVMPGAFAGVFGGIAQLLAAMWAYKNRDGLSTAFHGVWGAFWLAFGIENFVIALGSLPAAAVGPTIHSMGFWWIGMAFITGMCALAALATNLALFGVMVIATVASIAMAYGVLGSAGGSVTVGGYLLIISAIFAWYTSGAMMMEDSFGYSILPIGEFRTSAEEDVVSEGIGEPGVLHGQWGAYNRKRVHQKSHASVIDRRGPVPPAEA